MHFLNNCMRAPYTVILNNFAGEINHFLKKVLQNSWVKIPKSSIKHFPSLDNLPALAIKIDFPNISKDFKISKKNGLGGQVRMVWVALQSVKFNLWQSKML